MNDQLERHPAGSTSSTSEAVVADALTVIDQALSRMLERELVSSVEVADLLLDVRSALTGN